MAKTTDKQTDKSTKKPDRPARPKRPGRTSMPHPAGTAYPFDAAVPVGYNWATMKLLHKKDFATNTLFFEYKAAECDVKKAAFLKAAEAAKKGPKAAGAAKKLVKMQEKMIELRKTLTDQGINVDEMLAQMAAQAK
jgi:hypothetical protein